MSTQLGNNTVFAASTFFACRTSIIRCEMVETRSNRRTIHRSIRPSTFCATRFRSMPIRNAASTSKSWMCSQALAPQMRAASQPPGAQANAGATTMMTSGLQNI